MMDYKQAFERQREEIMSLREDLMIAKANAEGDYPTAQSWLQRKVARQRRALHRLNRRVVAQRFELRTVNEMGRGLSVEERKAAHAVDDQRELVDLALL